MPRSRTRRKKRVSERPVRPDSKQASIALQFTLAVEAEQRGNMQAAMRHYMQIIVLDPRRAEAHNRLGVCAAKQDEYVTAVRHFGEAARLAPDNGPIRRNFGVALYRDSEYEDAVVQLQRAIDLGENTFEVRYHLAASHFARGNASTALELADEILADFPDQHRTILLRGRILLALGRMNEAVTIFKGLIAAGQRLPSAYYQLSLARKTEDEPAELQVVETLITSGDYKDGDLASLHFAAGKFASDCGQHDRAFPHYIAANGASGETFDIGAYTELVGGMIERTTPEFFAERRSFGDPTRQPVFIFGMPRSGTTLTEQIIGSHPRADAAGEIDFFNKRTGLLGFKTLPAVQFLDRMAALDESEASRLAGDYLDLLRGRSLRNDRIIDKMPHNFEQIWLLSLLFPNGTFIHATRDPIDTCLSCFTNQLNRNHAYSTDLETLGTYYRLYDRLTRHWEKVAPVRILRSKYEKLVSEPEMQSKRLVAHTGLEWDEACASHHQARTSVRTLSSWQVRQPVNRKSINRWQRYDRHLGPLKASLGDLLTDDTARSEFSSPA